MPNQVRVGVSGIGYPMVPYFYIGVIQGHDPLN